VFEFEQVSVMDSKAFTRKPKTLKLNTPMSLVEEQFGTSSKRMRHNPPEDQTEHASIPGIYMSNTIFYLEIV
jgi:hypothetical protein